MNLSRKWLSEFVSVEADDKEFAESMTLSGSKVELTHDLGAEIQNVVVGKVLSMEHHPDSDHMWVCQIDVGREEPVQIVTGAWNVHIDDLVPVAMHKSTLPGGKKIEKGKLRGVVSNGMLCSLKELNLTAEHDYPYAVITPAALLNDYKPLDPEKPSIPADIKAGDKVFGPVVCGKVLECETQSYGLYHTTLDIGGATASPDTACSNLHAGDLVAYNTKTDSICTLEDLHAEQREFPHCIADGIFVLNEDVKPGDDIAVVIGADDHVVEFEITPNRPDCLSVIGLAREASATFGRPLKLHTPEVKGCGGSIAELVDIDIEDGDLCLDAGTLTEEAVSPATALARIMYALREGWLLEQNDESREGVPCTRLALDQTGASDTDIVTTVWLRQADGTPFLGEIAVDGETILTVRFTAFGFCDTITDNS